MNNNMIAFGPTNLGKKIKIKTLNKFRNKNR